ncbi:MAG: hypothetical protein V1723_04655 [Candidatus Uhrbacteria bacterium]
MRNIPYGLLGKKMESHMDLTIVGRSQSEERARYWRCRAVGDHRGMARALEALIWCDPNEANNADTWVQLARACFDGDETQPSFAAAIRAIALDPLNVSALIIAADAALILGWRVVARDYYRRAAAVDARHPLAAIGLVRTHDESDDVSETTLAATSAIATAYRNTQHCRTIRDEARRFLAALPFNADIPPDILSLCGACRLIEARANRAEIIRVCTAVRIAPRVSTIVCLAVEALTSNEWHRKTGPTTPTQSGRVISLRPKVAERR